MYAHTHLPKFLIDATAATPNTAVFNNPNFPTIVPKMATVVCNDRQLYIDDLLIIEELNEFFDCEGEW